MEMATANPVQPIAKMTDSLTENSMPIYNDMANIASILHLVKDNIATASKKPVEEIKIEEVAPKEVQRLLKKYGATRIDDLNMRRLPRLISADKNMELCKKCKGAPCKRPDFDSYDHTVPALEVVDGELQLAFSWQCDHIKKAVLLEKASKGWHGAKIPFRYLDKTFADYEVTADNAQAVKAAKEFLKSGSGGLFFYGIPGTGKTFLASIVTKEFLKSGKSVIFGDVPTLLRILRDSFDNPNINLADLMRNLVTVGLLVLDDLGAERPTAWGVEQIHSIIDQRYNSENKPVIVTSNYRLAEIGERLNHPKDENGRFPNVTGDRIVSRLAEMCQRIEIKGKDRRL